MRVSFALLAFCLNTTTALADIRADVDTQVARIDQMVVITNHGLTPFMGKIDNGGF